MRFRPRRRAASRFRTAAQVGVRGMAWKTPGRARGLWNPQAVAPPADGLDHRGPLAELSPDRAHNSVDDVAADVGVSPDVAQQVRALHHLRLPLVEVVEDVELEPGEVDA